MISGIDVSEYQPPLDWAALRRDGVRYAFVRVGDGRHVDPRAAQHNTAARAAGVVTAPYFFARNAEDPVVQCRRFVTAAEAAGPWDGPLVVDYEQESLQGGPVRNWVETAVAHLEGQYARLIMWYSGWFIIRDQIGRSPILEQSLLWLPGGTRYNEEGAHISTAPTTPMAAPPGYVTSVHQWNQYGRAGGYGGNLDLNIMTEEAFGRYFSAAPGGPGAVAAPVASAGAAALAVMASAVGMVESPPGSNRTPIGAYWGLDGVNWCALAVAWAYDVAGFTLPTINVVPGLSKPGIWTWVPSAREYGRVNGQLVPMGEAKPGDVLVFSMSSSEDHTGLFEQWITPGQAFWSVEGNTSNSDADPNQTDGWYLARRRRSVSQVAAVWRPSMPSWPKTGAGIAARKGVRRMKAYRVNAAGEPVVMVEGGLWWPLVPLAEWTDYGKIEAAFEEAIQLGVMERHAPNATSSRGHTAPLSEAVLHGLMRRI